MRQLPFVYDTMENALGHVMERLSIPLRQWLESGFLLRNTLTQRKLTDFF